MRTAEIKEKIVELLAKARQAPPTAREIAEELGLSGAGRKRLGKLLAELHREGLIVPLRRGRYALGPETELLPGRLQLTRAGNGFVDTDKGSVFVPSEAVGTALPGDRVMVRLEVGENDRGPAGRVVRIIERSRHDIVGTLKSTGSFLYVLPLDPVYRRDFYVADAGGARLDDRVVVRFTNWQNRHVSPEGEILEVLGPADKPAGDTLAVMRQYGYEDGFPDKVMRKAEAASSLIESAGKREDLRSMFVLTIDPVKSRDYDDALSLERDSRGRRVLGVHIADVSHFVPAGGALDEEARRRGNSVYLPDKVLPMLPEQLSNGVCSLRPGVGRLTVSAFITFDDKGEVLSRRFARTVICSAARLTYDQVLALLEKGNAAAKKARRAHDGTGLDRRTSDKIMELDSLAQQLRQRRFDRHALDIRMRECEVELAADGTVSDIRLVLNDRSHQLIEECMVAANEAVDLELSNRGVATISRFHEPPREEKLQELALELQGMGYSPGNLAVPANLAAFMRSVNDDPLAHHVRVAVLKSMNRAVYSASQRGHFGLAKAFYTHFTSPIRRYTDLVVHRLLGAAVLDGEAAEKGSRRLPYRGPELEQISSYCSDTERRAEEAERMLAEIKKCRYLARESRDNPDREYEAVVVNVTNFGLFVELIEIQIDGLVHVSGISERFVRFDRRNRALRSGRDVFKVGKRIRVRVVDVDLDKRQAELVVA